MSDGVRSGSGVGRTWDPYLDAAAGESAQAAEPGP